MLQLSVLFPNCTEIALQIVVFSYCPANSMSVLLICLYGKRCYLVPLISLTGNLVSIKSHST